MLVVDPASRPVKGYVYALLDPLTGIIGYIGRTRVSLDARLRQHEQDGRMVLDAMRRDGAFLLPVTTNKALWIAWLALGGVRPEIGQLEIVTGDDRSKFEMVPEAEWYRILRWLGAPLTNALYPDAYFLGEELPPRGHREPVRPDPCPYTEALAEFVNLPPFVSGRYRDIRGRFARASIAELSGVAKRDEYWDCVRRRAQDHDQIVSIDFRALGLMADGPGSTTERIGST